MNAVSVIARDNPDNLLRPLVDRDDVRLGIAVLIQIPPTMLLKEYMRSVFIAVLRIISHAVWLLRLQKQPCPLLLLNLNRVVFDFFRYARRRLKRLGMVINTQVHGRHAQG